MELPVAVDISRLEHHTNRDPADRLTRHPGERAQPRGQLVHVQALARRERIEIARHDVHPALMSFDTAQQRAQFVCAPLLRQIAMDGAQVHAVNAQVAGGDNLEIRPLRPSDAAPHVSGNGDPAEEGDRVPL